MSAEQSCQHFGSLYCAQKTRDHCSPTCSRKIFYDEYLEDSDPDVDAPVPEEMGVVE